MKKVIFGIFAHPDDEAFGPAGTLLAEARAGTDIYLIVATDGAAGTNPDNHTNLGSVRLSEWQDAAALIGVTGTHHLGYPDSSLNNQAMLEIAQRIEELVTQRLSTYHEPVQVEFMSFELGGLTGHIDHIAVARAACLAFYRLKSNDDERFTRLRLFCLPHSEQPGINTDWVFMDAGYAPEQVDEVVDISPYHAELTGVINAHHSQRHDGAKALERLQDTTKPKADHFIVRS